VLTGEREPAAAVRAIDGAAAALARR
jgi:hypothetical protein